MARATANQIGGMILEEVVLFLLSGSGYRTVTSDRNDATLVQQGDAMSVRGRGAKHQIDAIADYEYPPPFGQPQRLLVEAKLLGAKVDLTIVRNALGVFRDVNEYWIGATDSTLAQRPRHHYQYAIFSAMGFTRPAQEFAFAQDIFLLSLSDSPFLRAIVAAAGQHAEVLHRTLIERSDLTLSRLRQDLRESLTNLRRPVHHLDADDINPLLDECRRVRFGLLGMLQSRIPILLIPHPDVQLSSISSRETVRIFWDREGWYIGTPSGRKLFSFSIPEHLFDLYASGGLLGDTEALNLKQQQMARIVAVLESPTGGHRFVEFRLDTEWIDQVRAGY